MPKIRRKDLPPSLFQHLLDRVDERRISEEQLGLFASWFPGSVLRSTLARCVGNREFNLAGEGEGQPHPHSVNLGVQ